MPLLLILIRFGVIIIWMSKRIDLALEEVEYIKTQIEKLLSTTKALNSYVSSPKSATKKYRYTNGTKSTNEKSDRKRSQSPQFKNREQTSPLPVPTVTISRPPLPKKSKNEAQKTVQNSVPKIQNQISKKSAFMQLQSIFDQNNKSKVPPVHEKKSMQPQTQHNKTHPITQQKIIELDNMNLKQPKHNSHERSASFSNSKSGDFNPLSHDNRYHLRTEVDFLKRKYRYQQQTPKQPNLKKKYELLDERLNRIRAQFSLLKLPNKNTKSKVKQIKDDNKRLVLSSYARLSPLRMYVKANEHIKKQNRSVSLIERKQPRLNLKQEQMWWIEDLRS